MGSWGPKIEIDGIPQCRDAATAADSLDAIRRHLMLPWCISTSQRPTPMVDGTPGVANSRRVPNPYPWH